MFLRWFVFSLLSGLLLVLAPEKSAALVLTGPARVVDGDTLEIAGRKIRIFGLDAPERSQTCRSEQQVVWRCGDWVSARLARQLRGQAVSCRGDHYGRYGRLIARCSVAGADIGRWLVANGFAFAYRKYSSAYVKDETAARQRDLGLWSGAIQTPAVYRHLGNGRKLARNLAPDPAPNPACAIKGNISPNGQIYHVPGSKFYRRTTINPAKGERWFCSVKQALAAGWRAPRG